MAVRIRAPILRPSHCAARPAEEDFVTEDAQSPVNADSSKRADALIGYQMAVTLWTYQGEQRWARFNIILFINSVIVGGISWAFTSHPSYLVLRLGLPLAGFGLCVLWLILNQREATYADYYTMAARELEEKYLSDTLQTVSRGGQLADGHPVTLRIGGQPVPLRMNRLARLLRAKTISDVVICILGLTYFALLLCAVSPWARLGCWCATTA